MSFTTDDMSAGMAAVERLLKIAHGDTGQSRRVTNFLLAWWNGARDGGFDLTDLWNVDDAIADDMITVFRMIANTRFYPDIYGPSFEKLVTEWRCPTKRRATR